MESKSLTSWLVTVALVLIVITVALALAAWREQKKQTQVGAQSLRFVPNVFVT